MTRPDCRCWNRAADAGWGPALALDPSPPPHDRRCEAGHHPDSHRARYPELYPAPVPGHGAGALARQRQNDDRTEQLDATGNPHPHSNDRDPLNLGRCTRCHDLGCRCDTQPARRGPIASMQHPYWWAD